MLDRTREGSTVARSLRRGSERLAAALEGSRLVHAVSRLRRATGDDDDAGNRARHRASVAVRSSTIGTVLGAGAAVGDRLSGAATGARVFAVGLAVRSWALASAGYRWLTAEPDPDVIVIDLRETRTVGPIIAAIDGAVVAVKGSAATSRIDDLAAGGLSLVRARPVRVASLFAIGAVASGVALAAGTGALTQWTVAASLALLALSALGLRSRRTLEELCSSRPVRILAAAFEPPEPPARAVDGRSADGTDLEDDSEGAVDEAN